MTLAEVFIKVVKLFVSGSRNQRYGWGFTSGKGTFSYEKSGDACTDLRIVEIVCIRAQLFVPIKEHIY